MLLKLCVTYLLERTRLVLHRALRYTKSCLWSVVRAAVFLVSTVGQLTSWLAS